MDFVFTPGNLLLLEKAFFHLAAGNDLAASAWGRFAAFLITGTP